MHVDIMHALMAIIVVLLVTHGFVWVGLALGVMIVVSYITLFCLLHQHLNKALNDLFQIGEKSV
jgi:hypothetical protein